MSRYVIIGAGAIGALLAAQLELAGVETVLVARGANLEALRGQGGVRVRRPSGTELVPVAVVGGPGEVTLTPDDVLVLAVKTQDAEDVLRDWAWRPVGEEGVAADLPVLTFQNGLATEDLALRRFPRVYGVSIGVAASYLVPGEVVSPSWPVIGVAWLGRYPDAADEDQDAFVKDLGAAGLAIEGVPDISARKARKLLGNVGNGLDVLSGSPSEKAAVRELLVAEALAVYAAAGIVPASADWPGEVPLTVGTVPGHTPGRLSTWQSFARGASSEVDHLNGEIVLLGRRFAVPAPVNEALQRLLGEQSRDRLPVQTHPVTALLPTAPATQAAQAARLLDELRPLVDVTSEVVEGARHDRSGQPAPGVPLGVVRARTTDDVRATLAAASRHRVPVVPRGAGSGLAGAATAGEGVVVLDLSGLDRVLAIDPVDGTARVEPGVVTADLDAAAREHGLFYAPDPGSVGVSTIGGNIATNAGGLRGAKYGVTGDAVLALDVVLADGSLVHLGRDTVKGVAGLDLVSLLVGSEGTLGVVVGATVRLLPRPPRTATAAAWFASVADAAAASVALAETRLPDGGLVRPSVVELVDGATLAAIDDLRGTRLAAEGDAFLLVQADGFGAAEEIGAIARILQPWVTSLRTTTDDEIAAGLSAARRDALPAIEARGPVLIEDIAVPRRRLAEAVAGVHRIAEATGVDIYVFAHAADGNLHPIISLAGLEPGPGGGVPAAAQRAADAVFALALELGGTITAEHGVGSLKRAWVEREIGPVALALHDRVKSAFDPARLLNPGKAF